MLRASPTHSPAARKRIAALRVPPTAVGRNEVEDPSGQAPRGLAASYAPDAGGRRGVLARIYLVDGFIYTLRVYAVELAASVEPEDRAKVGGAPLGGTRPERGEGRPQTP